MYAHFSNKETEAQTKLTDSRELGSGAELRMQPQWVECSAPGLFPPLQATRDDTAKLGNGYSTSGKQGLQRGKDMLHGGL
jgi:hypothetical protein